MELIPKTMKQKKSMFDEALRATRIDMSPAERKQFFSQFIKTMHMTIAENGDVVLEFKRK